jgi:hypothetical protein
MGISAFTPLGNTVTFTGATSAPTPVQASGYGPGANQYLIVNAGNTTVNLGVGVNASAATANAVAIAGATPTIPLLPNTGRVYTFQPNAYFTGLTAANTSVIYITPGDGI